MVTLVKHEWHQVDSQFAYELDSDKLSEIYPDKDEDEIENLLEQIENGDYDIYELMNDLYENGVEIEWDRQYDDWWTDRKGGYEITYELGNDESWVDNSPAPPYHKCTKCRWTGGKYETLTMYLNEDGSVCADDDAEHHSTKEVCPMCDSDVELTEDGKKQELEYKKLMSELDDIRLK